MAGERGKPFLRSSDVSGPGGFLTVSLAAGAASAADITVTGLTPSSKIAWVHDLTDFVDRTADVTLVKANAFRLSSVTTSKTLQVGWLSGV